MPKKISIFHQFLDNIGGAEIVTLTLARELCADIYTTNIDQEKIKKMGFSDVLPRIHSIGRIPKNPPLRQQIALYKFRKLNLGNTYDFYIIAGDWALGAAKNHTPNLWYVHSPLNEIWAFKTYISKHLVSWWKRPLFELWVLINRTLTKRYAREVERWIANSENTKSRIQKFYGQHSHVICPPIDTTKYSYKEPKNYWLSVNRFVRTKRIELQIEAFRQLPEENLVIVASYEKGSALFESYKKHIESICPPNVTIHNWIDATELKNLYSECKGFITTAKDEDFGMTAVEAMASGKPVIATNEGGLKETVLHEKTGLLVDAEISDIVKAIQKISKSPTSYKTTCQKRALAFDTKIFIEKIKTILRT